MPTRGDQPLLVDTSVAIALLVTDHEHHAATVEALGRRRLGLCGHAAFEAFSVLTRLPPPLRRTPATVTQLLTANFPESRYLPERDSARLLAGLADAGLAGGSVYDALVGATAVAHDLTLATRDRRAAETYRALTVDVLWAG